MVTDVFESAFKQRKASFQKYVDSKKKTLNISQYTDGEKVKMVLDRIRDEINSGIVELKKGT